MAFKNVNLAFAAVFILIISSSLYSSDWPIYKGNLYFTGNNDEIIVKNNSLKWLFMASNYIFNPIVSDGRVYFADMDKFVYCVDEEDGKLLWKLDMQAVSAHFASAAGVAGKVKYPVIRGNSLFISDATAIYCLDKFNGKILWARAGLQENEKKVAVIDGIYADPIISGDTIYYGTRKNFIAREVREGHVQWSAPGIESFSGFPTYYDDKILVQSRDFRKNTYTVLCLNAADGKTIWQRQIDNPIQIFSPVVYQGHVFIPTGKKLVCLDLADGKKLWEKEFEDVITSNPSFTDREVLFTLGNGRVAVVDPDNGSIRYDLDFGFRAAPYFVTIQDQIYVAHNYNKSIGGKDVAFTAAKAFRFGEKTPIWEFLPPFPGAPSQPSASKGVLFLPAGNYLYAIGTYYGSPITYGNDGNTTVALASSSSSSDEFGDSLSSEASSVSSRSSIPQSRPAVSSVSSASSSVIPQEPQKYVDLGVTKKGETVVVPNIYFEFNQAYLVRDSIQSLNNAIEQLKRNPNIKLEIRGHTDNVGDKNYNQKLSERRADAVMNYFIKNGISPERLRSVGFGMNKPIADNSTEQGRSKNRRTEFLILEK